MKNMSAPEILLICALLVVCAGCTGPSSGTPVSSQPVFSNGSVVTNTPWISMDPVGDHKKGETFTLTGSTGLQQKSIIEVIIVPSSNGSVATIKTLDDCILEKQKCVLYFGKVTTGNAGVNRWSIRTDDSMDLFWHDTVNRYTVIAGNVQGNISVRSEFGLT